MDFVELVETSFNSLRNAGFVLEMVSFLLDFTSYILDYDQVKCEYALHNAKIYSADT